MAGRKITIEFLGKDVSASKAARGVDDSTSKLGDRMTKVGNIAGKVFAGGLLLAGAAAVKAGNAAAEDEAAQSKLANTLRNAANASGAQVKSTEAWITAQGKALGVADDELRPALGKLAVATHDVAEAQKLSSLAMDVSAGSGKSLDQVTTALQKGVNGSVGGLSRLGVATKNADGSTKSLKQITDELAKTYSGAAAKAADTTAGKQRKLKVQFGELQEQIGAKLLPVFSKLTDAGLKMIDWMSKHETLVKVLAGVIGGLVGTLWLVSKAMAAVNLVMSLNPIGLVVIAIAALVAGLVYAYQNSETFRKIVKGAFEAVGTAASFMWNGVIKPVFRFLVNAWMTVAGAIINGAARAFGWVPGIGPKLKAAATWFNDFKIQVNNQIDGIKDPKIKVSTPGADNAISSLATIKQLIHDIKSAGPVKPPPNTLGGLLDKGRRHATGGRVQANRVYSWNENGREMFMSNSPGTMRTAQQSRAGGGDFAVAAPLVLQLDTGVIWKGLLKVKRERGNVSLGLA